MRDFAGCWVLQRTQPENINSSAHIVAQNCATSCELNTVCDNIVQYNGIRSSIVW